jgi:subtilase family serine protease
LQILWFFGLLTLNKNMHEYVKIDGVTINQYRIDYDGGSSYKTGSININTIINHHPVTNTVTILEEENRIYRLFFRDVINKEQVTNLLNIKDTNRDMYYNILQSLENDGKYPTA